MPSTFPATGDALTNPTAADQLSSPIVPHDDQHADANDAIEALESLFLEDGANARVWIPAGAMTIVSGAPTLGLLSGVPCWLLDDTAQESVGGTALVPAYWNSAEIRFWWAAVGAGPGDVYIAADRGGWAEGDLITTQVVGGNVPHTALAQNVVQESLQASLTSLNPQAMAYVEFRRAAANAFDTLVGDMALFGIALVRSS